MIPSTVLGLLVFAASIGPGYVYVRVAERRNPRPERTPLLEAAELVVLGGLLSTGAFLLLLLVGGKATDIVDLDAFARDQTRYLIANPAQALFLLSALPFAYLVAYVAAHVVHLHQPAAIALGYSAWHKVLEDQPGVPYTTVDLKDGTTVAGYAYAYTVEEAELDRRELALFKPIKTRQQLGAGWVASKSEVVILHGRDIAAISVSYRKADEPLVPVVRSFVAYGIRGLALATGALITAASAFDVSRRLWLLVGVLALLALVGRWLTLAWSRAEGIPEDDLAGPLAKVAEPPVFTLVRTLPGGVVCAAALAAALFAWTPLAAALAGLVAGAGLARLLRAGAVVRWGTRHQRQLLLNRRRFGRERRLATTFKRYPSLRDLQRYFNTT